MPLIDWIALNTANGLGPVRIKHLLDRFGSPEAVFACSSAELQQCSLIPDECLEELRSGELHARAEKQAAAAEKCGVWICTLADKEYPPYLREIYAPPPVLYIKGDRSVFSRHAVAVVGTRSPSSYGRAVTATMVKELVSHGLAIVSGLASGVDVIAHTTTVDAEGSTIAVLGSGIDHAYSNRNPRLNDRIVATGALISEFPMGTPPVPFNFPRRNRIISGLSAGTLVIEGSEKSGALITAYYAVQQGRDVFAVPGPITSPLSMGPFNLIKQGAIPARSGHEIAQALSLIDNPGLVHNTLSASPPLPIGLLSEQEREVFARLGPTPQRIDELAEATGKPVMHLFSVLLNLELKGFARQLSGQLFIRPELLTTI